MTDAEKERWLRAIEQRMSQTRQVPQDADEEWVEAELTRICDETRSEEDEEDGISPIHGARWDELHEALKSDSRPGSRLLLLGCDAWMCGESAEFPYGYVVIVETEKTTSFYAYLPEQFKLAEFMAERAEVWY